MDASLTDDLEYSGIVSSHGAKNVSRLKWKIEALGPYKSASAPAESAGTSGNSLSKQKIVSELPFEMDGSPIMGSPKKMPLVWTLKHCKDTGVMSISLDFKDDPHYLMSVDYIQTSVDRSVWIMSKDDVIFHKSELVNLNGSAYNGQPFEQWVLFNTKTDWDRFVDEDDSLTLNLSVCICFENDEELGSGFFDFNDLTLGS